ncbi:diacylglycerol acyltransferase-domain-containing protein [Schizophyllum amplum]|uniref:Diacylglycerol O-acyltransferase n=1 Tax=Schizophyllum amplum TaxID=97359 RepID=A0A550C239_9AGAR|nr:diacylglycerol acyltransferase-domain-containing protein [Auriculariopsis ampla]
MSSPSTPKERARSLSSTSLGDRLSKLTKTPVAALHDIDFVPAKIPPKRRFQMLAVSVWSVLMPLMISVFLVLCSFPQLWPLLAVYYVWMRWIDQSPEHGGTADLPADRPYVFGYHPHGVGALATFATEATGFSAAFPGIKPHLLTLASNFFIPFYRDIILALGICSVSKRSCSNILKAGPGMRSPSLGFIKVAIQHGADLVPVFSFGENDIYQQMPNERGTTVYTLQKKFQSVFGFTLPLFHGRGLLNYNLGLLPYRRRIVVVCGRPIHVQQCDKPDLAEVMRIQTLYIDELTRIWDTYKNEFAKARTRELSIID